MRKMNCRRLRRVLAAVCLALFAVCVPVGALAEASPAAGRLWLVTEQTRSDKLNGELYRLMASFEAAHPGTQVEIEILPVKAEPRAQRMEEIRQMIDAGTGPDLYVLPTGTMLTLDNPNGIPLVRIEPLFADVKAQMEQGTFLDLGGLYDADRELDAEKLLTAVMDAGVMDGCRYVLPLRFDVPSYCFLGPIGEEAPTGTVTEMLEWAAGKDDPALAWSLSENAGHCYEPLFVFSGKDSPEKERFLTALENLVNMTEKETVTGCPELAVYNCDGEDSEELLPAYVGGIDSMAGLEAIAGWEQLSARILPVRSVTGDVTASVTWYGAVGASCAEPQLAYEFLRELLREDSQWEASRSEYAGDFPLGLLEKGWPVRTEGSVEKLWPTMCAEIKNTEFRNFCTQQTREDSAVYAVFASITNAGFPVEAVSKGDFTFDLPAGYQITDITDKSCSIADADGTVVGGFVLTGLTAGSVRNMDRDMDVYLSNIDESYEYISWSGGDFRHPTQNLSLNITIPGREEKKVYSRIFFVKDSGVYDMWFDCDLIDGKAISEFYPIAGIE